MCGFGDSWIRAARPDEEEPGEDHAVRNALIIFIKNPQKGKVKTRLAESIGEDKALEAYQLMLAHTREVAMASGTRNFLFYSEFVDRDDEWPDRHFEKAVQVSGELGVKMLDAFERVKAAGAKRMVIVGSDCLDLKAEHLREAFQALETMDFVLGPAEDGGYYLLGMNDLHPELFRNKTWSTASVLPDTLRDIEALGGTVHLLETLSDVDYEEDLLRALENRSTH